MDGQRSSGQQAPQAQRHHYECSHHQQGPLEPWEPAIDGRGSRKGRKEEVEDHGQRRAQNHVVRDHEPARRGGHVGLIEWGDGNESSEQKRQQPGVAIFQAKKQDGQAYRQEQQRVQVKHPDGHELLGGD
jgi:hypothetical protein